MKSVQYNDLKDLNELVIKDSKVCNFLDKETTREIIKNVLKHFVDSIGHTLGPYGTSNLIQTVSGGSTPIYNSKDGFEAVKQIRYSEPIPSGIRDSIKDLAMHMLKSIGDGTTSGYPILDELYRSILDEEKKSLKGISPVGISNLFDLIFEYFIDIYNNKKFNKEFSVLFSDATSDEEKIAIIRKIAAISANNDYQIADTVTELFKDKLTPGDETGVDLKLSEGEEDEIERTSGFELMYGFTDQAFANQDDSLSLIFDNPKFLMIDGLINNNDKEVLTNIIRGVTDGVIGGERYETLPKYPLIICADSFAPNIIAHVLSMKKGNAFHRRVMPTPENPAGLEKVEYPVALFAMSNLQGEFERERFMDMVIALGATEIDAKNDKLKFEGIDTLQGFQQKIACNLGSAKKIEATLYGTKIYGGAGKPDKVKARLEYLQKIYDSKHANASYNEVTAPGYIIKSRMAMLKQNMSRIKIGGLTLKEKERRRTVYDDVVRSIQSTIRDGGYILGGQITIPWILENNELRATIVNEIAEKVKSQRTNICIASEDYDTSLKAIIDSLLKIISKAFSTSYKMSMLNAFTDQTYVDKIFNELINNQTLTNYNILTGEYISLSGSPLLCSDLIVPKNTDIELMKAIFAIAKDLLTSGASITFNPIDIRFKDQLSVANTVF